MSSEGPGRPKQYHRECIDPKYQRRDAKREAVAEMRSALRLVAPLEFRPAAPPIARPTTQDLISSLDSALIRGAQKLAAEIDQVPAISLPAALYQLAKTKKEVSGGIAQTYSDFSLILPEREGAG